MYWRNKTDNYRKGGAMNKELLKVMRALISDTEYVARKMSNDLNSPLELDQEFDGAVEHLKAAYEIMRNDK